MRHSQFCQLSAITFLFVAGCGDKNPAPVKLPPPIVEIAVPVQREVTNHEIFTARTEAVQSVKIMARVTGYLKKVNFKDGAVVNKGDLLFQIDDRPYKAALDQANGEVELQKASLLKAQASLDIALATQKNNPGAVSKQELAKRTGMRDEAAGAVKAAQAQLDNAKLNYGWCKVTAPITGRIDRHLVDVGNLITQDKTTLTSIVSLKPIYAYFDVDENTAEKLSQLVQEGKIKSARKFPVAVRLALGIQQDYNFQGKVDFISNQVDSNTGSIRVRAAFPNKKETLLSGMFARIQVPIGARHSALLVADQAVGTNQGQNFVLVVNADDQVEYRVVEVGQVHDGLREVMRYREVIRSAANGKETKEKVEMLKPTDRVIVNGLQRVKPGIKVRPKQVDMQTLLDVSPRKGKSKSK